MGIAEARLVEADRGVHAVPEQLRFFDLARQRAQALAPTLARLRQHPEQEPPGYLWGLPILVKDLTTVKGAPCTYGSPLHRWSIAEHNHPMIDVLEGHGGIPFAKSNTPEFGAGAHSFNSLFATTATPHDETKTAGGSSGGSAASLAACSCWLATGTDLGGSLRIPAAFCGVVGLRPSPALVPQLPSAAPFDSLHSLHGPMARSVEDLALLLDATAGDTGWSFRCRSQTDRAHSFFEAARVGRAAAAAGEPLRDVQLVFDADIGGTCAGFIDPEIVAVCSQAAATLRAAARPGAGDAGSVSDTKSSPLAPIFRGVDVESLFRVLRAEVMPCFCLRSLM